MTTDAPKPAVRTVLLANVGTRDVQWADGTPFVLRDAASSGNTRDTVRNATLRYLEDYRADPEIRELITAPIIEKVLKTVGAQGGTVTHASLFYTDQDENTATPAHYGNDTVHVAAILEKWLPEMHSDMVGSVSTHRISAPDIALSDQMYAYFRNAFLRDGRLRGMRDDLSRPSRFVVSCASGTTGANVGLILAATEFFGESVVIMHPSENQPQAVPMQIASMLRRQALRLPVQNLLRQGYFAAAATVIDSWNERATAPLGGAARAIQRWLDFDDHTGLAILTDTVQQAGNVAPRVRSVTDKIAKELGERTSTVLIGADRSVEDRHNVHPEAARRRFTDLYWSADLCISQNRLFDFITRVHRLHEAILRWKLRTLLKVKTDDIGTRDKLATRRTFWEKARAKIGPDALPSTVHDQERNIDIDALILVIDQLGAAGLDQMTSLAKHARCVDAVRNLRNKNIHGFEGVSEDDIEKLVAPKIKGQNLAATIGGSGSRALMACLRGMLASIDMAPNEKNPFIDLGDRLADALTAVDALENA